MTMNNGLPVLNSIKRPAYKNLHDYLFQMGCAYPAHPARSEELKDYLSDLGFKGHPDFPGQKMYDVRAVIIDIYRRQRKQEKKDKKKAARQLAEHKAALLEIKETQLAEQLGQEASFFQKHGGMGFHLLANLFPLMSEDQIDALAADIRTNGLKEPIITFEGKIIDGRNRYLACLRALVEPVFKEYTGTDALGYVISFNIKRRHLEPAQRAMIAAGIADMKVGNNQHSSNELTSVKGAAKAMGCSVTNVKHAKVIQSKGIPELKEAVNQNKIAISRAAMISGLDPKDQYFIVTQPKKPKEAIIGLFEAALNLHEIKIYLTDDEYGLICKAMGSLNDEARFITQTVLKAIKDAESANHTYSGLQHAY